jgi:hypothetical protein
MKNNSTHGGRRKGSGQPKKAPTKTIAVRVQEKHYDEIKEKVKALIQKIEDQDE